MNKGEGLNQSRDQRFLSHTWMGESQATTPGAGLIQVNQEKGIQDI